MSADCDKPLVADVCVVGGGPAGSVAATCLAMRGHRVVMIDRGRSSYRVECLPLPCWAILDSLGIRQEIRTADLMPCPVTRLQWPGPRREVRVHEQSVLVQRGRFDRMLLDIARRSGATVLSSARAAPPTWSGSDWRLVVSHAQWRRSIVSWFLVDASGRRSGLPRRRRRLSPPTVALSGSCIGAFLDQAEMRVEAIEEGWCWGAFLPDGTAEVSVFLDTGDCAGLGGSDRLGVFRRALGASGLFGALAPTATSIAVCDSSAFVDEDPVSEQAIKVGDAVITFDPLSSQGVQAALRSAVQAAAVVHTILSGGDRGAALEFYRNALADSATHHRTIAAQYYSACDRWPNAKFWRGRHGAVAGVAAQPAEMPDLSDDPPLFFSPDARFAPVPTLTDGAISYRMALAHPRLTRPVAYIGGVALADLLPGISVGQHASRTVAAWMPLLPRDRGRAVLDWLVRTGVLVAGGDL
jgi:flavin-dependent dehydrogenase